MEICSEQPEKENQTILLYLREEVGVVDWPHTIFLCLSLLKEGSGGHKYILWRERTGCSESQPMLCKWSWTQGLRGCGPTPVLGAEDCSPFSHTQTQVLAEAACCLGGVFGSGNLQGGQGGTQMREAGMWAASGWLQSQWEDQQKKLSSFFQVSGVQCYIYRITGVCAGLPREERKQKFKAIFRRKDWLLIDYVKKMHDTLVERAYGLQSGNFCPTNNWPRVGHLTSLSFIRFPPIKSGSMVPLLQGIMNGIICTNLVLMSVACDWLCAWMTIHIKVESTIAIGSLFYYVSPALLTILSYWKDVNVRRAQEDEWPEDLRSEPVEGSNWFQSSDFLGFPGWLS